MKLDVPATILPSAQPRFLSQRHTLDWGRKANTMDFPFEHNTGHFVDSASDLLAQTLYICRRGFSCIDQEIGVLLRDHRAASSQAAAPGGIDQTPCRLTSRVCKGRA